ncbi:DsbA family protein [Nocardia goodfellowii]|uniref:Protein-disulfide isomerase n=1 Tax=Nocardia goodfellowii TaxID=882446 RepID=A0ABS4QAX9_9NOCA|nr:thioredoxin domain-containing protein [Nocardia goodfellowii]MBP2188728.1 protein-disulfide isomerase [Nocardia goodfellowii]
MSKNPGGRKNPNPLAAVQQADRNRNLAIQIGVAAVIIGLIAAIGIGIALKKKEKDDPGPTPSIPAAAAANGVTGSLTDNGSIRIGKPEAKTTVRVVADLQCPACQGFEAQYKDLLEKNVADGKIAVEYNIISFLDKASGTEYSTRAANASYCVAEADPAKYQTWLSAMFTAQPPEGAGGLTNDQIIAISKQAGYGDDVASCINDQKYSKYVKLKTEEAFDSGVQQTPTVFVDGKQVNPAQLEQAIAGAAGQ